MTPSTRQPTFEVIEPGLLLTVQDLGRSAAAELGVPRAGAADRDSLAAANRLAGNPAGAAALEATLLGPTLRFLRDMTVALAGADLAAFAEPGHRPLAVGWDHRLHAGELLECTEPGDPERGCRVYLAVAGGIDVPEVLGSRSTSLVGAFGGFDGRPLRSGDVLAVQVPEAGAQPVVLPDMTGGSPPADVTWRRPLRLFPGPAAREPGGRERLAALVATTWTISHDSDRRGLRLDTDDQRTTAILRIESADRPSHGVVPGTIQVTPSGQPLVLMPDGGVTGGYPALAIVASEGQPALGQLVPGAELRFVRG